MYLYYNLYLYLIILYIFLLYSVTPMIQSVTHRLNHWSTNPSFCWVGFNNYATNPKISYHLIRSDYCSIWFWYIAVTTHYYAERSKNSDTSISFSSHSCHVGHYNCTGASVVSMTWGRKAEKVPKILKCKEQAPTLP